MYVYGLAENKRLNIRRMKKGQQGQEETKAVSFLRMCTHFNVIILAGISKRTLCLLSNQCGFSKSIMTFSSSLHKGFIFSFFPK